MKKLLLKTLLLLCCMIAGVNSAWGQATPCYTLDTTADGNAGTNSSYTTEGSKEVDEITWYATGNMQMQPWRIGGKASSSSTTATLDVSRTVYTATAMEDAIESIKLYIGDVTVNTFTSVVLTVSSKADFSSITDEITKSSPSASSTLTFSPTSGSSWDSGLYYKFTINATLKGKSNTYVQFSKVEFYEYSSGGVSTPSITASNVNIAQDATNGSIAYTLANASGNVSAVVTSGDWLTLGEITASAVPFTCSANTGAQRTAQVTLSFTGATDKVVTITQAKKTVAAPTFSPDGGTFWQGTTLTLTSAGNTIYYTTDGSTPTASSTEYTGPISIAVGKITYKAIAKDSYGNFSSVVSRTFTGVAPATLPFSWDAKETSTTGVISTSVSTYDSSPYLKFDATNDNLILKFDEVPGTLTFDIKGNSFSGGTFKVQTSADGETYTDLKEYTSLGDKTTESFILANTVRYIKWIYTEKSSGNVALGKINLTSTIALTPAKTYTTLTSAKDLDFTSVSSNLKAFIATEIADSKVQMTQVNKVPANTGLVLKATTPGSAVNVPVFDGTSADDVSENKMVGSATTTTAITENGGYILSNGVFQPAKAGTLAAGKAYLAIAASGVHALTMSFDEEDGIYQIEDGRLNIENAKIYNLAGQRLSKMQRGINIVNGKKYIKK